MTIKMMRNNFSSILCFVAVFLFSGKAHSKGTWVYFDLGDTVVKTKDMKKIHYVAGAREYIEKLKSEGFKVGIISNIPESWGMDYDEKLQSLKKVIEDGWSEPNPFDWGVYDEILLPLKDRDMKPAPLLFQKAMDKAEGCPSLYIGESPKEIDAAKGLGMAAKLFVEADQDLYIPLNDLKKFIADNYQREYDPDCL